MSLLSAWDLALGEHWRCAKLKHPANPRQRRINPRETPASRPLSFTPVHCFHAQFGNLLGIKDVRCRLATCGFPDPRGQGQDAKAGTRRDHFTLPVPLLIFARLFLARRVGFSPQT